MRSANSIVSILQRGRVTSRLRGNAIQQCTCACVMAERRCSAHADVEQRNGGTLSARKPRDPLPSYYYIDQWSAPFDVDTHRSNFRRRIKAPTKHRQSHVNRARKRKRWNVRSTCGRLKVLPGFTCGTESENAMQSKRYIYKQMLRLNQHKY